MLLYSDFGVDPHLSQFAGADSSLFSVPDTCGLIKSFVFSRTVVHMSEELLSHASQRAAVAAMATGQCAIAKDAIQIIIAVKLGQLQKPIFIRPRRPLSIPGSVGQRNLCVLWKP